MRTSVSIAAPVFHIFQRHFQSISQSQCVQATMIRQGSIVLGLPSAVLTRWRDASEMNVIWWSLPKCFMFRCVYILTQCSEMAPIYQGVGVMSYRCFGHIKFVTDISSGNELEMTEQGHWHQVQNRIITIWCVYCDSFVYDALSVMSNYVYVLCMYSWLVIYCLSIKWKKPKNKTVISHIKADYIYKE